MAAIEAKTINECVCRISKRSNDGLIGCCWNISMEGRRKILSESLSFLNFQLFKLKFGGIDMILFYYKSAL